MVSRSRGPKDDWHGWPKREGPSDGPLKSPLKYWWFPGGAHFALEISLLQGQLEKLTLFRQVKSSLQILQTDTFFIWFRTSDKITFEHHLQIRNQFLLEIFASYYL